MTRSRPLTCRTLARYRGRRAIHHVGAHQESAGCGPLPCASGCLQPTAELSPDVRRDPHPRPRRGLTAQPCGDRQPSAARTTIRPAPTGQPSAGTRFVCLAASALRVRHHPNRVAVMACSVASTSPCSSCSCRATRLIASPGSGRSQQHTQRRPGGAHGAEATPRSSAASSLAEGRPRADRRSIRDHRTGPGEVLARAAPRTDPLAPAA